MEMVKQRSIKQDDTVQYKTVLAAKPLRDRELLGRMKVSILHRDWPLRGSLHCGHTAGGREGAHPSRCVKCEACMFCGGNSSHACTLVTCVFGNRLGSND